MRKIISTELLELLDQGMSQKEAAHHFNCSEPAISRRLKKIRPREARAFEKLTKKQKNFTLALAEGQSKTKAAALSYDTTTIDSARTIGKRLSVDSDIKIAVAEILQRNGLTKQYRVNRLRELVDSLDPSVVLRALEITFKLDGSYSPETHNINVRTHEEIVQSRQTLEEASRQAQERKEVALKQITAIKTKGQAGEKP
jgi:predicted transcriptional regulator